MDYGWSHNENFLEFLFVIYFVVSKDSVPKSFPIFCELFPRWFRKLHHVTICLGQNAICAEGLEQIDNRFKVESHRTLHLMLMKLWFECDAGSKCAN